MTEQLWCVRCGQVPYEPARRAQKRLEATRQANRVPDLLLLLEHPPVYTKGRRSEPGELGMGEDWYRMQGIEVCQTDRGGRVTYHGPGQLVGYPIVSLGTMGVVEYIRRIERVVIASLAAFGVAARVVEGLTGVWAGDEPGEDPAADVAAGRLRKIGSIGIHVNRGVTTHGFAVNVNNDLQPFEWITPCGIDGCRMTSLCAELGKAQRMPAYMDEVSAWFAEAFGRETTPLTAGELAGRVAGVDALAEAEGALARDGAAAPVR